MKKFVLLLTLVVLASAAYAGQALNHPTGCMWYFDFEDGGAGGMTADLAVVPGYPQRDGIVHNIGVNPIYADPYGQRGMILDPTLGMVQVTTPDPQKGAFNTDVTMSVWVAPYDWEQDGLEDNVNEQWKYIMGRESWGPRMFSSNSSFNGYTQSILRDDGWNDLVDINCNLWRGSDWMTDGTGPWHHLLFTVDHDNSTGYAYVDGVLYGTETEHGGAAGVIVDWYADFFIGAENLGAMAGGNQTSWLIDGAAVWHGFATQADVDALYAGADPRQVNLVPEPASMLLLGLGGVLLRRKR